MVEWQGRVEAQWQGSGPPIPSQIQSDSTALYIEAYERFLVNKSVWLKTCLTFFSQSVYFHKKQALCTLDFYSLPF